MRDMSFVENKALGMNGKSAGKSVRGRPFRRGADPRRGRGPKSGAPNAGRPPSIVRERCRGSFDERISIAEAIADDEAAPASERLRALELIGRIGLASAGEVSVAEVESRLIKTVATIKLMLPADVADELLMAIKPHWT